MPTAPDCPRYLTANEVRTRFGGISQMTLWRWLRDPALAFPQPLTVNRRRLFDEAAIREWAERRRTAA